MLKGTHTLVVKVKGEYALRVMDAVSKYGKHGKITSHYSTDDGHVIFVILWRSLRDEKAFEKRLIKHELTDLLDNMSVMEQ